MSKRTERELRRAVDDLRGAGDQVVPGATVKWGDAAPAKRPDGMRWDVPADSDDDEFPTLRYDLWSAQRDALDRLQDHDDDVVAFLAGYGTGKSVFGARWLIAQALQYPGSRFLAMGVSFQEARETTYPKLFEALPGERTDLVTADYNGPETSPIVADYNRQNNRITLVNDSTIALGSADKYSRFAGAEFGAVWMDEPSHYGDTLHDLLGMITTRIRGVDGAKKQLWTLTGEGYNAAWEILEKRHDADGEPIGLDIHITYGSVLENPYLDDGSKERFKRQYEGTGKEKQALHGGFAAATGLVYSNFSRDTHVIPDDEARDRVDDDWRVYGYDSGWSDPRIVLEIGRTPLDQLVVLDSFHESESHVDDAIAWLDQNDKPDGKIFAEHEPSHVAKFRRAGYQVEKADKKIDAGIDEVRRRLRDDGNTAVDSSSGNGSLVMEVKPPIEAPFSDSQEEDDEKRPQVGLLVSERCTELIREFLGYKEEHVGTSQAVDHELDSLRYAVMGVAGDGTDDSWGAVMNV